MIRPIPQRPIGSKLQKRLLCTLSAAGLLALMLPERAAAAELYDADGLDIRWDNTLRYSAGIRLAAESPILLGFANSNDGDSDFAPGLVSNRLDVVSVLDITGDSFGVQASFDGWYDTVYHTRTDNKSPASYNPISVPSTQFARAVRDLDGQYAEIGDSFVYGNFIIDSMPVSVRVGRQTLLWGESLFFGANGIAAAQAPVDYIKSIGTPEGYAKNVFLPVDQVSLTVQPRSDLSLAAYYQLEWRASRLPGVGSYFSDTDIAGAGAERAFLTQGQFLLHGTDQTPPAGGQYGVSLQGNYDELDVGFYALRYDAKYPVVTAMPFGGTPSPSGAIGQFESEYPTGIDLYGFSFSTYLEGSNIAGEASLRRHMPLVSIAAVSSYNPAPLRALAGMGYAEGDTLQAQFSSVTTLSHALLWDSADLSAEVAANDLLAATQNEADLSPSHKHFAGSFRGLFQPHYFELLPNLDGSLVFGLGFNFTGRSSTDYTENAGTGDFELGVSATYLSVWKADLTMTSFLGAPARQFLADRDFLQFSIERTF